MGTILNSGDEILEINSSRHGDTASGQETVGPEVCVCVCACGEGVEEHDPECWTLLQQAAYFQESGKLLPSLAVRTTLTFFGSGFTIQDI